MKKLIMYVWQVLQNICGVVVKIANKSPVYCEYKDVTVYSWKLGGGISLGNYIFVPFYKSSSKLSDYQKKYIDNYIKHEYGHCIQSKYLGPLYLFVIGIPSLIWASCFNKYRTKHNKSYYWFYTEKWADKLGGVKRDT